MPETDLPPRVELETVKAMYDVFRERLSAHPLRATLRPREETVDVTLYSSKQVQGTATEPQRESLQDAPSYQALIEEMELLKGRDAGHSEFLVYKRNDDDEFEIEVFHEAFADRVPITNGNHLEQKMLGDKAVAMMERVWPERSSSTPLVLDVIVDKHKDVRLFANRRIRQRQFEV